MRLVKNHYPVLLLVLFFLIVFFTALFQRADPDMYWHYVYGGIYAHKGLISQEIATISLPGTTREFFHYEWLFQILFYWFTLIFGFENYGIFIAILSLLQIGAMYILFRKGLSFNFFPSILASFFYFLLVYNFLVARPQILAMTCLISEIIIYLLFLKRNKNLLLFLLPLTYVWANFHTSFIVGIYLCFAYATLCIICFTITKEVMWIKKTLWLILIGIGMGLASILPPQYFTQYKMMEIFSKYAMLIQNLTAEWQPITDNVALYFFYVFFALVPLGITGIILYKKKNISITILWLLPIILFIFYGFSAFRNMYYGFVASSILFGWILSKISWKQLSYASKIFLSLFLIGIFFYTLLQQYGTYSTAILPYPTAAANFLATHRIRGNMFNQYVYGGYLEYRLYPKYKVFIDARTIPYPCCVMQDYYSLQTHAATLSDADFQTYVDALLKKYDISYAILFMGDDNSGQILSAVLRKDPTWTLVFSTMNSAIYIKKDGKNTQLIQQYRLL